LNVPFRLTAICWSKTASSVAATLDSSMMPALLTKTSTPPNSFSATSNIRETSSALLTSAFAAMARPPADLISLTSAAASASLPA
jgi:hypothetical protein